ncbi:unnamed protein product [Adineta steineri]|uniref:Phytanoyl-CoA dioxygenase n=2 Tax=Adineta steineri TaxID=433720 RepID=A0A815I547_9BILA|nr:unnamed protein product [Adineta steineri]
MEIPYSYDKDGIRIDYTALTPRYSVTNNESLNEGISYLNDHGYAVFSDVLSQDEINFNKDLLWKFLENIPDFNIRRDDPSTWSNRWPGFKTSGVVNSDGIGQSEFMWNIRSNRNVKRVYSQIWNTNELLVSFDGCGIYRDWRYDSEWKTKPAWYHVDQNPVIKPHRCCVQGFVSLTNQNEKTGGLIVFPHTHLRFQELSNLGNRRSDFLMIRSKHPIFDGGQAIGKLVQCQTGDLVLWDSRLVHCNSPAFLTDEIDRNQPIDLLRIVAYVSMSPTTFIRGYTLDEFRKQRKLLVQNNCTLSHWSTELKQASSGEHLPKMSMKNLNAYQRALILGTDVDDE